MWMNNGAPVHNARFLWFRDVIQQGNYDPPYPCEACGRITDEPMLVMWAERDAPVWVIQHGPNPEAITRFDTVPYPSIRARQQALREHIVAWVERVHAYEQGR
jgi:hypothetical protein